MLRARGRLLQFAHDMRTRECAKEKCVWKKNPETYEDIITKCNEQIMYSATRSATASYKFCPFCGKEIKYEWIRR